MCRSVVNKLKWGASDKGFVVPCGQGVFQWHSTFAAGRLTFVLSSDLNAGSGLPMGAGRGTAESQDLRHPFFLGFATMLNAPEPTEAQEKGNGK